MKFPKTILATTLKSIVILCFITSLTSCSSDDDSGSSDEPGDTNNVTLPADRITTYNGVLSFETASGELTETLNGSATISGSSSNYTISFSDNVPSISGITFIFEDDSYIYVNPNDDSEGVVIDEDNRLIVDLTINNNLTEFVGN